MGTGFDRFLGRRRQLTREVEGSPTFVSRNLEMATGVRWDISYENGVDFPNSRKYLPLDFLEVVNNSTQDISTYLNGGAEKRVIKAGVVREFRQAIYRLAIVNDGAGTIAADELEITAQRMEADADSAAKKAAGGGVLGAFR
jgi:hypothetical protein